TLGLQDALSFHARNGELSKRNAWRVNLVASLPLGIIGILAMAVLGLFIFKDGRSDYAQFLVLALFAPIHIVSNTLIGSLTGASDVRGVNLVKVVPAILRTAVVVFACLAFDLSAFVAALLFMITMVPGAILGFLRLRSDADEPPELR